MYSASMERATPSLPDSPPRLPHGERRRTVRQKLHTPVYASFNNPQSGAVVDLSELLDLHEHGFAVQTAIPNGTEKTDRLEVNRAVKLCLDLPETRKFVHGTGQVIWTDNNGRAGIRFSFLPDASRQILKEWLFANLLIAASNHTARAEQLALRKQEEDKYSSAHAPASAERPIPPRAPLRQKSVEEPGQATPHETHAALLSEAELLSASEAVRRLIQQLKAQDHVARHPAEPAVEPGESAPRDIADLETRKNADPDATLGLIAERAMTLTGASGAAIALLTNERMLCRARSGDPAPPLGSEVNVKEGLSGACIRSGQLVSCENTESDLRVDPEICRALGIGSFLATPIFADFKVVGLLEVFSPYPRTFSKPHESILQRLAELVPGPGNQEIQGESSRPSPVEPEVSQPEVVQPDATLPEAAAQLPQHTAHGEEPQNLESHFQNLQTEELQHHEPQSEHDNSQNGGRASLFAATQFTKRQISKSEIPEQQANEQQNRESQDRDAQNEDLQNKDLQSKDLQSKDLQNNDLQNQDLQNKDLQNEDQQNLAQPAASLQNEPSPDANAAPPRRLRTANLVLSFLVLGTLAMVVGYLLAPTIEKHWPRSSQAPPASQQAFLKTDSASSVVLQDASSRQGHAISPDDLRKLAEQGDPDSQWQLGVLYHDGELVPKDDAQAVQWFERSAEQGFVSAQSTLGAYYEAGRGVPQDFSKAFFWSVLALAQGDENSKYRLQDLSARMTPSQIAAARQQAEAWLHAHTQPPAK